MDSTRYLIFSAILLISLFSLKLKAQQKDFITVSASKDEQKAGFAIDGNIETEWTLAAGDLRQGQYLQMALAKPGAVNGLLLKLEGLSAIELKKEISVYVTYDPMNVGKPVVYSVERDEDNYVLNFKARYGAHLKLLFKQGNHMGPIKIKEIQVHYAPDKIDRVRTLKDRPWMDTTLSVGQRVKQLLAVMRPEDKIELLREGWGIPGIPKFGIPFVNKVEAIHGFSYGSGATIFPQSIALGATWDKKLVKQVGEVIGDETAEANTTQAWSPVLDVAQDPRWGRCEETYGEDPVLVSDIGGAWMEGMENKGIMITPKHFAGHGAPIGGRDSHDNGLSEREMREIHLVPFREAVEKYNCDAVMVAYSAFNGEPDAKSKTLLKDILRDEWGFKGFVVSDCGAIGNLTSRKHYTAIDKVEAANQSLAAGVATNCGDTYNDPEVIAAVKDGRINMDNLDFTCSTLLATMFRNGLFEHNPSKPLDWNRSYPGWNSDAHKEVARKAEQEAIVLLKNESQLLPLNRSLKKIAVIGPGADNLQPGDYTAKLQPGQLISVLSGIKAHVDNHTQITYQMGCAFIGDDSLDIEAAVRAASTSDVAVLVLGDCSTSEAIHGIKKTSGEANDYAALILPGRQQELLEAVCKTGKPVILILQSGRPYNLSYAAKHCKAILVNWLPGQEGGPATADVLFGDYNPAGRLPMTFPRSAAQLPLYYNFKPSGRGYNYVDMDFSPLFRFGFGLSYTTFEYSDLRTHVLADGTVKVEVSVKNTGMRKGDEVVQLYLTDMYSSVDTRVMELKDFERITLSPDQTKSVSFSLTPYQLSLLNEHMDRVVEPGKFKIMVGGMSPSYVAGDAIKNTVGYKSPARGLSTILEYKKSFAADFNILPKGFLKDSLNGRQLYAVQISNKGNITDAGKVTMFCNGKVWDEHHFEIMPGGEKLIYFDCSQMDGKNLAELNAYMLFTTKHKSAVIKL